MIKLYPSIPLSACFIFIFCTTVANAQCPDGGTPSQTFFDTTIQFGTGINSTQVKFPKFDPENGMLRCVKLVVTITGVIDTVAMQNYSGSSQTANFYYNREDQMSGPGLTPSLQNSSSNHYGPYNLSAYDGTPGSGGDFRSISRDTVLQKIMDRTLTDSVEISQFYGQDSVTYNYTINVTTSAVITGGSSSNLVLTSAFVNFRFEYCVCPSSTLPINLKDFQVIKISDSTADVRWQQRRPSPANHYTAEVSEDGLNFTAIKLAKAEDGRDGFRVRFSRPKNGRKKFFFRIRQASSAGKIKYSEVKPVDFSDGTTAEFMIYPNPSRGSFTLGLSNTTNNENYQMEIITSQGRVAFTSTNYKFGFPILAPLPAGVYLIRLKNSVTGQLLTKRLIIE